MSSIAEMKSEYQTPYEVYDLVKGMYKSNGRGIGLELLENYKHTHSQLDIELFTLCVLYGTFNEMIKESEFTRVRYCDVQPPAYSRTMIIDMVSLRYPVTKIIRDVDGQHARCCQIPFRELAVTESFDESLQFNERAINTLIASYVGH